MNMEAIEGLAVSEWRLANGSKWQGAFDQVADMFLGISLLAQRDDDKDAEGVAWILYKVARDHHYRARGFTQGAQQ